MTHTMQAPTAGNEARSWNARTLRDEDALDVFVGKWRVEGENAPSADGAPGSRVAGEESYERMPGGFFVLGSWSRKFDTGTHVGTSVMGVDPETRAYFAHHYDNLGYARKYDLLLNGKQWTYSGMFERATLTFGDDDRTFRVVWERSAEGHVWMPLCDLQAVRR